MPTLSVTTVQAIPDSPPPESPSPPVTEPCAWLKVDRRRGTPTSSTSTRMSSMVRGTRSLAARSDSATLSLTRACIPT